MLHPPAAGASASTAASAPAPGAALGVRVSAPGRLHLGFLDPGGTLGRRFGSVGLVVDGPATTLELRPCASDRVTAGDAAAEAELPRARAHLDALRRATGRLAPLHLHLAGVLPAHAGLGSGTQLALAVGRAFGLLMDEPLDSPTVARVTGRGLRSGIGIAGFDRGGLLLDGGPGPDGSPAPLLSRVVLPAEWRVLLVLDPRVRGLAGAAERAALATLPPLPRERAAEVCHEVLMRVVAGAAVGDFPAFAAGVTRVQQVLGSHFAPAQAGSAWSSPAVGRLLQHLAAEIPAGIGQSSWGPTGFAIVASAAAAQAALAAARAAGAADPALQVQLVRARDRGADVCTLGTVHRS